MKRFINSVMSDDYTLWVLGIGKGGVARCKYCNKFISWKMSILAQDDYSQRHCPHCKVKFNMELKIC